MSALISSLMGGNGETDDSTVPENRDGSVYGNPIMYKMMKSMLNAEVSTNNLEKLKAYFEQHKDELAQYSTAIQYGYDIKLNVYATDPNGEYAKADFIDLINKFDNGSHLFILKNDYNDKYALGYDHIVPCIKFSDSTTFDKDDCGEYLKIVNNDNSFAPEKHYIKDIVAITYADDKEVCCKYLLH